MASVWLHARDDAGERGVQRDTPLAAQFASVAGRKPMRVDRCRYVRDAALVEPEREQRIPVLRAVDHDAVRPAQEPEAPSERARGHVRPPLRGADDAQLGIPPPTRCPQRERVVVRKRGVKDVVSAFPCENGESHGIVDHVAQAYLPRQAQPGLPGNAGVGEVLPEVLAGSHGVSRKSCVEALPAQLAGQRDQTLHGPRPRRARDHEERGTRPAHAESSGRRPAESSGRRAAQARSSPRSSMQRKWPRGQRRLPKKEHGAQGTLAKRTSWP